MATGLLDAIKQIAGLPTALKQQKLQYQQAKLMMQLYPQYAQTLQAINSSINGGADATQTPSASGSAPSAPSPTAAAPPSQQPQSASSAGGLLNGAQAPTGGLLNPPTASAPSRGLLNSTGAGATPTAPAQPQAAAGQPGSQLDPWKLYQYGVQLQGLPFDQAQKEGKALSEYAGARIANDPDIATQLATAKSPLAQDQLLLRQAQAKGDQEGMRAAQIKFLTDAGRLKIANNNGAATLVGGGDINQLGVSGVNPEQGYGYNGREMYALPGAPQAIRARAAAQAQGEAAGKTIELTAPPGTPYAGMKYEVPLDQFLNSQRGATSAPGTTGATAPGATPGAAAAPAAGGAPGNVTELPPQQESALRARGTESQNYVHQLQESADSAVTANYAIDNMKAAYAAQPVPMGPGADTRKWITEKFTSLAQTVNPNYKVPASLNTYQELDKNSVMLGMATSRALGSREAAQIVTLAVNNNPNKSMGVPAFNWVANSIKALNSYVIAKNKAIQGADTQSPGAAQQAAATWNSQVNPQVWDLALDPGLAATLAPRLGVAKIASSLPFMESGDAVSAFRNMPASIRAQVLAKLPAGVKAELAQGLQQ